MIAINVRPFYSYIWLCKIIRDKNHFRGVKETNGSKRPRSIHNSRFTSFARIFAATVLHSWLLIDLISEVGRETPWRDRWSRLDDFPSTNPRVLGIDREAALFAGRYPIGDGSNLTIIEFGEPTERQSEP